MAIPPEDRWVFYRQLVERSWEDQDFYEGMVTNPHETMENEDIELLPGEDISIVEDADGRKYFLLVNAAGRLIC